MLSGGKVDTVKRPKNSNQNRMRRQLHRRLRGEKEKKRGSDSKPRKKLRRK
jgi:hypothetical protein